MVTPRYDYHVDRPSYHFSLIKKGKKKKKKKKERLPLKLGVVCGGKRGPRTIGFNMRKILYGQAESLV